VVVGTTPGQGGGWLGTSFDPFVANYNEVARDFAPEGIRPAPEVDAARLEERRLLRDRLARRGDHASDLAGAAATRQLDNLYDKAFSILSSAKIRQTLSVQDESAALRDRYGRQCIGQSYLLARRLIEAGVRLVLVNDADKVGTGRMRWDTHMGNFTSLRQTLPETDQALSALLQDLQDRGLLESTLVVWMGEYGRTPQVHGGAGGNRDHWPHCYSVLLAGGGIRGGQVYGASDAHGAFPKEHPCRPEDIHATIYRALRIPERTELQDALGRPVSMYQGTPIAALFS